MSWLLLALAGVLEVGWAIGLKYSEGFSKLWPSAVTLILMALSFLFLAIALKHLPVGTAYAMWTGIGAIGTALLGMLLFGEAATIGRLASIALIVIGIAGLKYFTPHV